MKYLFLKKSICSLIALLICVLPCFALELDMSVDDEIRRNYNPSALENSLPALPKTAPSQQTSVPKNTSSTGSLSSSQTVTDYKYDKSVAIRIKKGTKFRVKSTSVISDSLNQGAKVSFTSLKPVTQRYVTINQGAKFTAVVKDSHLPQYTGNGGLIILMVDSMTYNGQTRSVHAKITKVNLKKVFLNNIKGKRGYWKGVANQIDKGENFYKKTRRTSNKLADNPIGLLISPIPTLTGIVVYAVNFVGSPLFGIWAKGARLSIPSGSEFEIKFLEDVYLY